MIQKYKAIIGKIDNKLKFYANIITSSGTLRNDLILECSRDIRNLSCELEEVYKQIPIAFLRERIKSKKLISDSASRLIRLSNNLYQSNENKHNHDDVEKIRENLDIPLL